MKLERYIYTRQTHCEICTLDYVCCCIQELSELLKDEKLAGVPVLVFANKQDLDLAMPPDKVRVCAQSLILMGGGGGGGVSLPLNTYIAQWSTLQAVLHR